MTEDLDDEVLADLALRDATELDTTRTRPAIYSWDKPKFVTLWRCRVPGCGEFVPTTQDAIDELAVFNRELVRRGEQPIDEHQVMYCDSCRLRLKASAPARRHGQVERMADAIRKLKASQDPLTERELVAQIRKWGHPDVDGLVTTLAAKNAASRNKKGRV